MSQAPNDDSLPAAETSLARYLDGLASDASIPGGGGAAALTGALGAALLSMVSRFTLGRERYEQSWPHIEPLLAESERLRQTLLQAAEDDARAYGEVGAAMRRPRSTRDQRRERRAALQAALHSATAVPLETARAARRALNLAATAAEHGNPNLVSDAGVAAALAEAALQSAALNVRINLASIRDGDFVATTEAELTELLTGAGEARAAVLAQVSEAISGS
ncbi:MAG: methenyltetrahydrofolate cyclohydrolase [Dehalococcoidia bacterium]|nr:methenyltetrahydrofolate cyclohydrolase [Dehalococcoidia bacterium]